MKNRKWMRISCRDQKSVCVAILPPNYSKWQEEYFSINFAYIPGSRKLWIARDEFNFSIHPMLNSVGANQARLITQMCNQHGFGKGIPFSLAERKDFNFEGMLE